MAREDDEATRLLNLGGLRATSTPDAAAQLPSFEVDGDAPLSSDASTVVAPSPRDEDDPLSRTQETDLLSTRDGSEAPPPSEQAIEELEPEALESVRDVATLLTSAEVEALTVEDEEPAEEEASDREDDELHDFDLDDELEPDGVTLFRRPQDLLDGPTLFRKPSAPDISTVDEADAKTRFAPEVETADPEEPDGPTMMFRPDVAARARAIAQAPKPPGNAKPPSTAFEPPALLATKPRPAYLVDTDEEEDALANERKFSALLDVYRKRLVSADTAAEKATLWHKVGSVYEHALGDPGDALSPLLEGFVLRPTDDALVRSLDRVALKTSRLTDVAARAKRELEGTAGETRVALLGHLVHWYERHLGRAADAAPYAAEIERLDRSHPIALRRAAQVALANGDTKGQRELLARALERVARPAEKTAFALILANAAPSAAEAQRHYEIALGWDPDSAIALAALERLGRAEDRHAQVAWALERLRTAARTDEDRTKAALRLADLYAMKFLDRAKAAEVLEQVLERSPNHAMTLEGLERCYHALRDWKNLARVLALREAIERDPKKRAQLAERAAEVHESKLDDLEAAADILARVTKKDPKNRRALGDLARIHEKRGDWSGVAAAKSLLAELAATPRQAAQHLVQLAEMLAKPARDPLAARQRLERAVVLDPSYLPAWEALQKVALEAGDERRALGCLRERAKHAQGPRARAAVLVELGIALEGSGDAKEAALAFEQAAKADPTNEAAAARVITRFVEAGRWKEAGPLSDLLVNAAVRDGDPVLHFDRLRLATRIHAGNGDADKAMTAALAALELRPDDAQARADLVTVTAACKDMPKILARATPWLGRLADDESVELPVDVLTRLGMLRREGGALDDAARLLERALTKAPEHARLTRELVDVHLARGDHERAAELLVGLAAAVGGDAAFPHLVEAGEIAWKRLRAPQKALPLFEEARQLRPLDHALLHTLMAIYGELEDWPRLVSVLQDVTRIQESPDKTAKSLWALAQVLRDKLGEPLRAVDALDALLDVEPSRLDAFEEVVRLLTEAADWERLERSYRKMLHRIHEDPSKADLRFHLFAQLGLIYRDRLEDAEKAYEALEAASRVRPDDAEARRVVTELLVVTDNLDAAVARTRERVELDPHDAGLYAELYELFLRQEAFDKAWCAVNVLVRMQGEVTAEQAEFHADYAPMPLADIPGQVLEEAWRSHLLHEDLDPTLTAIFGYMTPAVARMRHAQVQREQLGHVGRPLTPKHTRMAESVRRAFADAAEILGLPVPELLLGESHGVLPFSPALAPYGALYVSPAAVEASEDCLVYLVGKRLAAQRAELAARTFFPTVADLTALLAAAVRVSRREGGADAAAQALDAGLVAFLSPEEREAIRNVVMHAEMSGARVDVRRWFRAADLSSTRAGLLLAGDVGPARKVTLGEPQTPGDMSPRDKLGELYKFAVSDLFADLRAATGVAIGTE